MSLGPGRRCVSLTRGCWISCERTIWSLRERVEVGNWKRYKIGDSAVVARRFRSTIYASSNNRSSVLIISAHSVHKLPLLLFSHIFSELPVIFIRPEARSKLDLFFPKGAAIENTPRFPSEKLLLHTVAFNDSQRRLEVILALRHPKQTVTFSESRRG
jgi:hypothetical protein